MYRGRGCYSLMLLFWGLSLSFSHATQLRFFGAIGPAEVFLVLSIAICFLCGVHRKTSFSASGRFIEWFWPLSLLMLTAGTAWSALALNYYPEISHSILSYILLSLLVFFLSRLNFSDLNKIVLIFLTVFSFLAWVALLSGVGWYQSVRFSGFSENPNQVAFYILPIPFFSIICLRYSGFHFSFVLKFIILAFFLSAIYLGFLTSSDALLLGWLFSLGCMLVLAFFIKLRSCIEKFFGVFFSFFRVFCGDLFCAFCRSVRCFV